jgi:hypothetical protein
MRVTCSKSLQRQKKFTFIFGSTKTCRFQYLWSVVPHAITGSKGRTDWTHSIAWAREFLYSSPIQDCIVFFDETDTFLSAGSFVNMNMVSANAINLSSERQHIWVPPPLSDTIRCPTAILTQGASMLIEMKECSSRCTYSHSWSQYLVQSLKLSSLEPIQITVHGAAFFTHHNCLLVLMVALNLHWDLSMPLPSNVRLRHLILSKSNNFQLRRMEGL